MYTGQTFRQALQRMQASVWRPTSSASTLVRPLSSRTTWNSCGPSPGVTPVQSDVYGFMRSPVEDRGRSWKKTSRSSTAGTSFSMPMTVISVCGIVVQKRPLPSDSTTQTLPVSATEVGAADGDAGRQELSPQVE